MPRNRPLNQPIGTCPCPFKGCEKLGQVFRYRARSDDLSKQRHAGKLYMRCETHGLTSDQEWLLAEATITGEPSHPESAAAPDKPAETPPAPEKGAAKSPVTNNLEPGKATPSPKTDDEPEPGPEPFGFF